MVRPIYLPDFQGDQDGLKNSEVKERVERIRGVLKQRYGGRPGLMKVFQNFAVTKPGFIDPTDFKRILTQMGVRRS